MEKKEKKKNLVDEMEKNEKFLSTQLEILMNVYYSHDIKKIKEVLKNVLSFCDAKRVYVYEEVSSFEFVRTFAVCKDEKEIKKMLNEIKFNNEERKEFNNLFINKKIMFIDDFDKYKTVFSYAFSLLFKKGVKSLIIAPLLKANEVIGFICVDDPKIKINKNNLNSLRLIFSQLSSIKETFFSYLDIYTQNALEKLLSKEYSFVCRVNVKKDKIYLYKNYLDKRHFSHDINGKSFTEIFNKFVEEVVSEEDKVQLIENTKLENLQINSEKEVFFNLNEKFDDRFYELRIIPYDDNEMIFAFKETIDFAKETKEENKKINRDLTKKTIENEKMEKQIKIISSLAKLFDKSYVLDLKSKSAYSLENGFSESDFVCKIDSLKEAVEYLLNCNIDKSKGVSYYNTKFQEYKEILQQEDSVSCEMLNNDFKWIRANFITLAKEEGKITAGLLTYEEIDDEKKLELENQRKLDEAYNNLKSYHEQIETTLKGANTGLWTLEIKNGEAPKLIIDETMRKILGIEKLLPEENDVILNSRIFEGDRDKFNEYSSELAKGKGEVVYRWNHPLEGLTYMRCGGWRDFSYQDGLLFRGYHQNVTELYKKEIESKIELQKALEEARRANNAKTDFLSTMSHDLRTPMNAIVGLTSIAKKHVENKTVDDCLDKIQLSSNQLLSLINDVLDMNKIESGKVVLEHVPFNIYTLTDEVEHLVHELLIENNITLSVTASEVKHPYLIGSPLHVKQILMNILTNAIKYNKEKGYIYISMLEVNSSPTKSYIRISIRDTGIGMSPNFVKHIFDPFVQENSGARTKYKGTGLGMSIVKKLVDLMGGTIEVESVLNVGSTFSIILPFEKDLNPHIVKENVNDDISSCDFKGLNILLVEDNELNREIALELLQEYDMNIDTAEDGLVACNKFIKSDINHYDVILMDLRMPNMDGISATKNIRNLERSDALTVPIFAMTADAFTEDVKRVKDAGMNEHISKPLNIETLLKLIKKYCK